MHRSAINATCRIVLATYLSMLRPSSRLWCWTSLLIVHLYAPVASALQPNLKISQLQHTAWRTAEGAPADIWALAQSADGFLLLGTGSGVYRFDGVMFERVISSNNSDLAFRNVTALMALPSRELWIGYYAGGVSQLKDGVLKNFTSADGVPPGWVTSFAEESDGTLWVAALEGLGRFTGGRWETVSSNWDFPGHSAHWVLLDRTGTLWVAGGDTVAFLRKGSRHFEDTGVRSGYSSTLILAPDGTVWLSGESIAPQALSANGEVIATTDRNAKLNPTKRLLFDRQGAIWATDAVHGGVYRSTKQINDASPGQQSFNPPEAFDEASGLTSDKAVPLLEDREGNIWVGTNLGLNRFRAAPFVLESHVPATSRIGYSLAATPDTLWIASDNDLFEAHASRVDFVTRVPTRIRSAFYDSEGVLWLGTETGLYEINKSNRRFVPFPPYRKGVQYRYAHAMSSDGAQGMWVSIINHGLLRLRDGVWEIPAAQLGLRTDAPTALWTDESRRQWFGYSDGTVSMWDGARTRIYGPNEGLRVGPVTLIRGSGENILAAGEWGLGQVHGDQFRTLSASRADAFSGITGVIVGAGGGLWLNGNRGVVRMKWDALADALARPEAKPRFELYDVHDGLPGYAQQNENASAVQAPDGRLWFATNHGVSWMDPTHNPSNPPAPDVVIRGLQVDGRSYEAVRPIELPNTSGSIRIDYTALSLAAPERVSFRYKLDGVDHGWRDATNERAVRYANLRPGQYTFRVTASNNEGVWNELGTSLDFSISPAYYQTTWFRLLLALLFAALLWLAYYLRLRYVTERQRKRIEQRMEDRFGERTRIARELHDTLLQSLQGSLMRYQVAHELLPEHPSEAKQDLGMAIDQTVRAINEGRNAVQGLRATKIDGNDLPESIKKLVEDMAADASLKQMVLRVGLQGALHPLQVHALDEIHEIAAEALRNALHHSRASEIEVELIYEQDQFRLRVRDNGIGIDPNHLKGEAGHYGLQGMRERAELLGGKVGFWTASAAGTEIELIIPAAQVYAEAHKRRCPLFSKYISKRVYEVSNE
jgi:signal transduction histidine kinase/ligand-binding sensor domain-containing protein